MLGYMIGVAGGALGPYVYHDSIYGLFTGFTLPTDSFNKIVSPKF